MKYDLTQLRSQKVKEIEIDTSFTLKDDDSMLSNDTFTPGPIMVVGSIKPSGRDFIVNIKYTSTWKYLCGRCLDSTDHTIEGEIKRTIMKDKNDGDDGIVVVESSVIDLYDVIYNDVVLNLPQQVICDDECKGLCPDCGINLNSGACECAQEDIDPRLAKLKNLFTHN